MYKLKIVLQITSTDKCSHKQIHLAGSWYAEDHKCIMLSIHYLSTRYNRKKKYTTIQICCSDDISTSRLDPHIHILVLLYSLFSGRSTGRTHRMNNATARLKRLVCTSLLHQYFPFRYKFPFNRIWTQIHANEL